MLNSQNNYTLKLYSSINKPWKNCQLKIIVDNQIILDNITLTDSQYIYNFSIDSQKKYFYIRYSFIDFTTDNYFILYNDMQDIVFQSRYNDIIPTNIQINNIDNKLTQLTNITECPDVIKYASTHYGNCYMAKCIEHTEIIYFEKFDHDLQDVNDLLTGDKRYFVHNGNTFAFFGKTICLSSSFIPLLRIDQGYNNTLLIK